MHLTHFTMSMTVHQNIMEFILWKCFHEELEVRIHKIWYARHYLRGYLAQFNELHSIVEENLIMNIFHNCFSMLTLFIIILNRKYDAESKKCSKVSLINGLHFKFDFSKLLCKDSAN